MDSRQEKNSIAAVESESDIGGDLIKDADARRLAEMGYKPEMNRSFSVLSVLGVGFGLTNSWIGISAGLVVGIVSGGPILIVYGIIVAFIMSSFVGATLSELASAFPNSGGQYYWTTVLAPKRHARFLAYLTGAFSWAGAVLTTAAVTLSAASALVGMYALAHEGFEPKTWMVFVAYELVNIVTFVLNCKDRYLPHVTSAALYISLVSFVVVTLTVVIRSHGHYQTARFVFVEFENGTGWASAGIAFIVGLINPAWSFSCLDCATHMAEEVPQPERAVPIAIMGTLAIGFVTSFGYSIAMFFCIRNLDDIVNSATGVPILDIFFQALQSRAGAICLESLVLASIIFCNATSHTWQARLAWSFSRDQGFPGSRYWSKVDPRAGVPINAHFMSCVFVGILGCLYMGSTTAFNAMVTGTLLFQLASYAIPVTCLLIKGRSNITPGPFWLGRLGFVSNVLTLVWAVFAITFFSFPQVMPVTAGNMNYACAVVGGYTLYALVYWLLRGRYKFTTPALDMPHVEVLQGY